MVHNSCSTSLINDGLWLILFILFSAVVDGSCGTGCAMAPNFAGWCYPEAPTYVESIRTDTMAMAMGHNQQPGEMGPSQDVVLRQGYLRGFDSYGR